MKKILIVDDDKNMLEIYGEIFSERKEELSLVFAMSVEEAIDKLNRERIDLVVLDIIMEPLSGQYLYLKLIQDDKYKERNIPVLITSVLKKENLKNLERLSNNVYIFEKPFKSEAFLGKVDEMVFEKGGGKK